MALESREGYYQTNWKNSWKVWWYKPSIATTSFLSPPTNKFLIKVYNIFLFQIFSCRILFIAVYSIILKLILYYFSFSLRQYYSSFPNSLYF